MRQATSVALALVLVAGCARTGLLGFGDATGNAGEDGQGGSGGSGGTAGVAGTPSECFADSDCPVLDPCAPPTCVVEGCCESITRRCVSVPLVCDDGNACTRDRCDPELGACVSQVPDDLDGDGFVAEPPAGAPDGCGGLDCDDDDATVHPGASELCDGVDNDCNGAIDDGFDYAQVVSAPVLLSPPDLERAQHGGLAWNGSAFAVTYNTTSEHKQSFFKLITEAGADQSPELLVSAINADTYSGPIAWSGQSFLTVWSDARQSGNYEIYAARFGADGQKVQTDQRLSDAPDFSLNPTVVWTGSDYVVAWDDRRGRQDGGVPQIFGRRFSLHGEPLGGEQLLSPPNEWGEYPALAVGEHALGLAYVGVGDDGVAHARFRAFDLALGGGTAAVDLPGSANANSPSIAYVAGRFLVAWQLSYDDSTPGAAIIAASVDESGGAPLGGNHTTFAFSFCRFPSLVSLGDRAFMVFSGAGADGAYELWGTTLDATLSVSSSATRLTIQEGHALFPQASAGSDGRIGIVFDVDDESPPTTSRKPYFMAVGCARGDG